jgi:hypothetical protein
MKKLQIKLQCNKTMNSTSDIINKIMVIHPEK